MKKKLVLIVIVTLVLSTMFSWKYIEKAYNYVKDYVTDIFNGDEPDNPDTPNNPVIPDNPNVPVVPGGNLELSIDHIIF